jgi:DNA repair exonuclease SbcCD nuclease subunit
MAFIHAADLHLKLSEADYGLAVLDQLLDLAVEEGEGLLLLAGDVFDSNQDLAALFPRLRAAADAREGLEALLILAGNHDFLGGRADPESFRGGGRIIMAVKEARLVRAGRPGREIDFLLCPYGAELPEKAPARQGGPLVLAAHGSLPEMNWLGPPEEESDTADRSVLDSSRIQALGPAYAALGHIHEGKQRVLGGLCLAYPGSARPWRRGETGPRRALRVDFSPSGLAEPRPLELSAAGQYRRIEARLFPEAAFPDEPAREALARAGARDWVDVRICGLARTEAEALASEDDLRAAYGSSFRRLDVSHEDLVILAGAEEVPAAADFLKAWEAARARLEALHGEEAVLKALEVGLTRIARAGGVRS